MTATRIKVKLIQAVVKTGSLPGFQQSLLIGKGVLIARGRAALQEKEAHMAIKVEVSSSGPTPG